MLQRQAALTEMFSHTLDKKDILPFTIRCVAIKWPSRARWPTYKGIKSLVGREVTLYAVLSSCVPKEQLPYKFPCSLRTPLIIRALSIVTVMTRWSWRFFRWKFPTEMLENANGDQTVSCARMFNLSPLGYSAECAPLGGGGGRFCPKAHSRISDRSERDEVAIKRVFLSMSIS